MGLSITDISRVTGVDLQFKNFEVGRVTFLPQRIEVVGQGNSASTYSLDKYTVTTSGEAATRYGYGSPIHLAYRVWLVALA